MKIVILGTRGYPYVYSGYETFVAELAPRLTKRGHTVTVYCHKGLFKEFPAEVNGIKLFYIPSVQSKTLSQLSHSFLSTIHILFQSFDVVLYVNTANGPFGIITTLFRKKTAINVDGLEWLRPKWRGLGSKYFYFSSWLSTKVFDAIISDSDRMADIYRNEFSSDPVTIAYGANVAYSSDPSLVAQLGLKPNDYYLIVGRLIPDNNGDIIVSGFEKTHTKKKLVILGDVPYKDEYAERIRNTKDSRIIFPGYVRDGNVLRELYCNSYAYIHGHEFGGTNPSLLKALAYGSCVLALDTVFSREVLDENNYGMYFQKNADSVTEIINSVDNNAPLIEEYRNKSRKRIEERYTWDHITDQYEELFKTLVEPK